jgi:GAF domain-containing protein
MRQRKPMWSKRSNVGEGRAFSQFISCQRASSTYANQPVQVMPIHADLQEQVSALTRELAEAREQQTATSEVLSVISSSPGELEPVFQTMLENALRVCGAKFGLLYRFNGNVFHLAAGVGTPPELAEFVRQRGPFQPKPGSLLDIMIRTKQVRHSVDAAAEANPPHAVGLGGARSMLDVPMLKDDVLIGAIVIYRQEVRPFTDRQIALVENFPSQAVIAIENTRLLNELRESLRQQTATADVLKVISSSPGELEPVFQAILENATRICEAKFGTLFRFDGNAFRVAAGVGTPPELAEFERRRGPFRPELGSCLERIVGTKQVVHIVDDAAESVPSPPTRLAGARSTVAVPMLKDDVLIGAIAVSRQEVCHFTDKHIALLINFAAQAVIAIENAELLKQLRERTYQMEAQSQEIIKLNQRLRRFLPSQVADLIVASGTEKELESHRRDITALFCDLRGFTGFSESSDPEDVMALLRESCGDRQDCLRLWRHTGTFRWRWRHGDLQRPGAGREPCATGGEDGA